MFRIYLIASAADQHAATAFVEFAKQRGYQVRVPTIDGHFPPALPGEVTVALWSRDMMMSAGQIMFTNRAIDAWSEGRLVLARLDHALAPRGLSDVDMIDLSFEPSRQFNYQKIIETVSRIDRRPSEPPLPDAVIVPDEAGGSGAPKRAPAKPPDRPKGFGTAGGEEPQRGPTKSPAPGFWGRIFGRRASHGEAGHVPQDREEAGAPSQDTEQASAPAPAPAGAMGDLVFVSYARKNSDVVYPLVASVESLGRKVWIDRDDIQAGENWAVLIVRAIKSSGTFCLMCSADAFASDNVRREIYLADKYKRPMLPVRLDATEPPEDFEYFLIDRQWLDLSGLAPHDQARRLLEIFQQEQG